MKTPSSTNGVRAATEQPEQSVESETAAESYLPNEQDRVDAETDDLDHSWSSVVPLDQATTGADGDDRVTSGPRGRDHDLAELVEATAAKFRAAAPDQTSSSTEAGVGEGLAAVPLLPTVPLSIALMSSAVCHPVNVPVSCLAEFLNELGRAAARHAFVDVQFWVQRRTRRKDPSPEIWGFTLDVDITVDDPFAAVLDAGLPTPICWWRTRHGWKANWVFSAVADPDEFEALAQQFTLSVAGGDPKSWSVTQGQHVPYVNKSTVAEGITLIEFDAAQTNAQPLNIADFKPVVPLRLERAVGGVRNLAESERSLVEDYLGDLGIPVPDEPGGHELYPRCPAADQHDAPCCYVRRGDDGAIAITCMGGHDGEGKKRWSEVALYQLVTDTPLSASAINIVRDVPVTWAGREFLRHKFEAVFSTDEAKPVLLEASIKVWLRARAMHQLSTALTKAARDKVVIVSEPPLASLVWMYEQKLEGDRDTGRCQVYFDATWRELRIFRGDGTAQSVRARGDSLCPKKHRHEWMASMANDLVLAAVPVDAEDPAGPHQILAMHEIRAWYVSHWNKAMGGHPNFIAALGLPIVKCHDFAAAYLNDDWQIEPSTKGLHHVRAARLCGAAPTFDVMGFFRGLWKAGRLPLANEDDIARFVMCIASPLLRFVGVGLLGVYWMVGPSGAGKDYLAKVVTAIWKHAAGATVPVSFDLDLAGDMELKRTLYAAGGAIYARAKEAGKRVDMIDLLIRLGGTDEAAARGVYKDAVGIDNTYTYLADSVEDLPDRREVSRRTVIINVAHTDDEVSKGLVLDEIVAHAADIVASLKALVEQQPAEFYRNHANTCSRPVIPVALAAILGATLPEVTGASTDDLFEHIEKYLRVKVAGGVGEEQMKRARAKDGKEAGLFNSYPLAHFIDEMAIESGAKSFFKRYSSARLLVMFLDRECAYAEVKRGKAAYLPVDLGGARYAFKLVKGGRNFVFEKELVYCAKLGIEPIPHDVTDAKPPASVPPSTNDRERTEVMSTTGPIRFSQVRHRATAATKKGTL